MKKLRILLVALSFVLGAAFMTACLESSDETTDKNEIVFVEESSIPDVVMDKEYDFEPYFIKSKDTTYTMRALYLDEDLNEVEIEVDGFKFVQHEFANVFVTITAEKGDQTYLAEIELPIDTTYDDTDYWVTDSLFAGTGISKELNYYGRYKKGEDSVTSVKFTYKGVATKGTRISVLPFIDWPNNSRLTVTDWSNAVIVFDVFNPSEENLTFGFIMKHSSGITYSFDQCEKFVCVPDEWTHIEYSLRSLNLTEPFVFNPEYELSDRIIAQVVYDGAPEEPSVYSYDFFIDNVDICNYSAEEFPELDTTVYKEYEDVFTKDDALSAVFNNDYANSKKTAELYCYDKLVEYSKKSIKMILSENGEESKAFLHSFIGGNPNGWKPLDISKATMSFFIDVENADKVFDLTFESDDNVFAEPITIDLDKSQGTGWTVEQYDDGWYKVTVNVSEANIENALVRADFIRTMRLYFTNKSATEGQQSVIYLDTLILEGHKITEACGEEELDWTTKSPYTTLEDADMFTNDDNLVLTANGIRQDKDVSADIKAHSQNSNFSYKLVLSKDGENSGTAVVDSFFTGTPSHWKIMDISEAVFTFDVKVQNADSKFTVAFASDFNDKGLVLGAKLPIDVNLQSGDGWSVEALSDGWYRITIDVKNAAIQDETVGVTKDFIKIMHIVFTGKTAVAGELSAVWVDNLHVDGATETKVELDEEHPWDTKSPYVNYTITFLNKDGSVILQKKDYHYGDVVQEPENPNLDSMAKEGTFNFVGWDYEVTAVNCDATYTAVYSVQIKDLINCDVKSDGIDALTFDTETVSGESNRSLKISEPISSGNLPYIELTLDKGYDLTDKYIVFDIKMSERSGWLMVMDFVNGDKLGLWTMLSIKADKTENTHVCKSIADGWIKVYIDAKAIAGEKAIDNVTKIYFTLNASDGSGTLEMNIDNLHFVEKPKLSEKDDSIGGCGLNVVNGGTMTFDTEVVSINSEKSVKCYVPAGNNGVYWNYDLKLSDISGKPLYLSGKTISFDVKIVGNMKFVGFNIGNGNAVFNKVNDESYAWMNMTDGWSGFGFKCAGLGDGWFRFTLNIDNSFAVCGSNVSCLRFLVSQADANESQMYIDNLYLPTLTEEDDSVTSCGLRARNGGAMEVDTTVVSENSDKSVKCYVPAGNNGAYWNYDLKVVDINSKVLHLSGKTISFDVKIVGNMKFVGFNIGNGSAVFNKVNDESYAWMNMTDGWSGFGFKCYGLGDGWYRFTLAIDESFSSVGDDVGYLRFLLSPTDANESQMYIDNLYIG